MPMLFHRAVRVARALLRGLRHLSAALFFSLTLAASMAALATYHLWFVLDMRLQPPVSALAVGVANGQFGISFEPPIYDQRTLDRVPGLRQFIEHPTEPSLIPRVSWRWSSKRDLGENQYRAMQRQSVYTRAGHFGFDFSVARLNYPGGAPASPHYSLTLPLWFVALAFALATGFLGRPWWQAIRRIRRRKRGACPSCGYDMRETPERCPECGEVPKRKPKRPAPDALAATKA